MGNGDSKQRVSIGRNCRKDNLKWQGLQHQDGHSHIFASTIPNCRSYDPCFSYELATIVKEGIHDMYNLNNDRYYYLTLMNENYLHPEKPAHVSDSMIMKGAYCFMKNNCPHVRILASGLTLNFAIEAEKILKDYDINVEIWSVTSFNELYKDAIEVERSNRLFSKNESSYVEDCFSDELPTIGVSEYQRSFANQIRQWVHGKYVAQDDGYGRSDRENNLEISLKLVHVTW